MDVDIDTDLARYSLSFDTHGNGPLEYAKVRTNLDTDLLNDPAFTLTLCLVPNLVTRARLISPLQRT